jgi:RNA 2',3'-cyclic 3'-phosphodiesterase
MGGDLSKLERDVSARIFLAIALPPSLRAELAVLESSFASHATHLKWSAAELLHITVKFLGDVPVGRLGEVEDAARQAASLTAPFRLTTSSLGAFPNVRAPRVIWVGLEQDEGYEEMQRLFVRLEDGLAQRGFPRETRPFSPHITLARTRDRITAAERAELGTTLQQRQQKRLVPTSWRVGELLVMRSDLSRAGPRYTPLAAAPFQGGGAGPA